LTGKENASCIRVLDPATINQIAAGEVVERPASVVKELVENAIDAGADSVTIELKSEKDAITAIQVSDNGRGMSPEDALLAFTPHATSKISGIEDLSHIDTLGFRGEALATIAAVSLVTLTTKPAGSGPVPGTRVILRGGTIIENMGCGCPDGTRVMVEDLFFNTPARKKFQKSRNTELAHIHDICEGICLSHPDIAFHLVHNGNEYLTTECTGRQIDTIARLFGSSTVAELIPVAHTLPYLTITGYISRPSLSRKDRARMPVSVNKRYVTSGVITDAVKAGYGTLLPKDRFPVAFLSITIDTTLVDVNVHPTKKQIRLSREKEIASAIQAAVRDALFTSDLIPSAARQPEPIVPNTEEPMRSEPVIYPHYGKTTPPVVAESTHAGTTSTDKRLRQTELTAGSGTTPGASLLPPIGVIGEFGGIYILAQSENGEFLIIDQHAAHERILYEQVSERAAGPSSAQELISPVVLHRTQKDAAMIRELLPALAAEGFVMEDFGSGAFIVRAVPVVLGRIEDSATIDEIISDLVSNDAAQRVSNRERITRIVACRGAVKAGTTCTREQCQRIVDQLRQAKNPFTCPHGRPTIIRFTRNDLDAMFQRV